MPCHTNALFFIILVVKATSLFAAKRILGPLAFSLLVIKGLSLSTGSGGAFRV